MQLLEFYKQEVKNGMIDDMNDTNEITLQLANGEGLTIEGLMVYKKNMSDRLKEYSKRKM